MELCHTGLAEAIFMLQAERQQVIQVVVRLSVHRQRGGRLFQRSFREQTPDSMRSKPASLHPITAVQQDKRKDASKPLRRETPHFLNSRGAVYASGIKEPKDSKRDGFALGAVFSQGLSFTSIAIWLGWASVPPAGSPGQLITRDPTVQLALQEPVAPQWRLYSRTRPRDVPDALNIWPRGLGVERRLRLAARLPPPGLPPTVGGMHFQFTQHDVAVAPAASLGPGPTVIFMVLELAESQLNVTVLTRNRPQRTLESLWEEGRNDSSPPKAGWARNTLCAPLSGVHPTAP